MVDTIEPLSYGGGITGREYEGASSQVEGVRISKVLCASHQV